MKAAGESAALYVDMLAQVEEGDYIQTKTQRTYLVTDVRVQEKGKHAGRQHLKTVVMAKDHQIEPDARVHTIWWYKR